MNFAYQKTPFCGKNSIHLPEQQHILYQEGHEKEDITTTATRQTILIVWLIVWLTKSYG